MVTIGYFGWKMASHRSLGTYGILSDHFRGSSVKTNPADSITIFGANASEGAWAPTFYWNNTSSAQNFDALMAHTLHYYPVTNDNSKLRVVTCYRSTEVYKKDLATLGHIPYREDRGSEYLRWTAGNPILTTSHKPQTDGLLIFGQEETPRYSKFSNMTDINVPIRSMTIYGNIANNDFGKMTSQAATAENLFRKYMFPERPNFVRGIGYVSSTDMAMEWRDALFSEGYDMDRNLKGIGAGDLGRMHAHAVTLSRRHIALFSKLTSEAWELAYARGYKGRSAQEFVDRYIENVIEHETAHLYEKELPERISESNIRSMHGRVNAQRAASRRGTLQSRIYDTLSNHWYESAEAFSEGRTGRMSRLEAIAEEAVREAEEMGLEGKEARSYIENRLNEHTEDNEESDSEESKLEDAVNEPDAEAGLEDTDSTNEPSNGETSDNAPEAANDNDSGQESQAA